MRSPALSLRLARHRIVQHDAQIAVGNGGKIGEMAKRHRAWFQRLLRGGRGDGIGQALGAGADAVERLADLGVGDGQRRQQAHDIVAGRHRQQLLRRAAPC